MHQASDTNSAQKVCRILRVLSTPQPLRLADISSQSDVNKATTLRLLETLIAEGFVHRDAATKRYTLGDEAPVRQPIHCCFQVLPKSKPPAATGSCCRRRVNC